MIRVGDIVRILAVDDTSMRGIGEVIEINPYNPYEYEVEHFEESDYSGPWVHKEKVVHKIHYNPGCDSEFVYHKEKGWICPFCEL